MAAPEVGYAWLFSGSDWDVDHDRPGVMAGLGVAYEYAPASFLAVGAAFDVLRDVRGRAYVFLPDVSLRAWVPLGRFEPFLLVRTGQTVVHWVHYGCRDESGGCRRDTPSVGSGCSAESAACAVTSVHATLFGGLGLAVWADAGCSLGLLAGFRFALSPGREELDLGRLGLRTAFQGALTAGYRF
ncbi:MAG: hypothetical protein HY744_24095 [Deltaproteobacteria bacterium]|nr:hypothetical protein [Deltaproteobacteria bacterium]